jgi:hypothetical protein
MSEHDANANRLREARFRAGRDALADWISALLGPHAGAAPVDNIRHAAALHAEYRASERAAEGQEWALARASWPLADLDEAIDALHRVSSNLGPRGVWLIVPGREPHACPLASDVVLDNPLGFALLADQELALLDRDVPAGFSFKRYERESEDGGTDYEWELIVWGEPWLSATMRALREID